ncbi:MAG: helix-turn-helix domain-containing protein [Oscillospiraceae bacterium]|nr:helix-turn-helix domain-containing protein [Oscillospiraceae bacterium]
MEFRKKLVQLRKEKKLSQMQVADALNVSRQAVSKWEVGDVEPSTANLIALAALYDVSLDYLVGNADIQNQLERCETSPPATEAEKKISSWCRRWILVAAASCFVVALLVWGVLNRSMASATLWIIITTVVVGAANLYWEVIKYLRRR